MDRYATLSRKSDDILTIWEVDADGRHKVVERGRPAADADGLAVWKFDVDTTDLTASEANAGNYPVVDADGSPLWPGARVEYAQHARLIEVHKGQGTIGPFDRYGGTPLHTDNPMPRQITRDAWKPDTEHYCNCADYQRDGDLAGFMVLKREVGSQHHLGVFETWLRLAEDPRTMCALLHEPDSAPRVMPI